MHLAHTKNPLLVQDDVGRAKPTCYDLPGDNFAYGRPENGDLEGAREVTMQWVSHKPNVQVKENTNFITINKRIAAHKGLKARDLTMEEKKASPAKPEVAPKIHPSDVIPGFTYGKKTRPSTPIASVISNQYCAEYEAAMDLNYHQYQREKKAVQSIEVQDTKATAGHKAGAERRQAEAAKHVMGEQKELFKMTKFKKVKAKIDMRDPYVDVRERVEAKTKSKGDAQEKVASECEAPESP